MAAIAPGGKCDIFRVEWLLIHIALWGEFEAHFAKLDDVHSLKVSSVVGTQ